MRRLTIISLSLICILVGCGSRKVNNLGDESYKSATGATKTVEIVANDPKLVEDMPAHASVLEAATGNLKTSLQIDKAKPEQVGTPLVTAEELDADPQQAAEVATVVAAQRDAVVREEQESGWFAQVLGWGGWGLLAGGGLFVARLLGVPGIQYLSDPLVRWIGRPWISRIEEHEAELQDTITTLWNTVEGSMAGRSGLAILDRMLGDSLAEEISKLTHGNATTLEGLFKWLAKSYVIDGEKDQAEIDNLLGEIKNQMHTTEGIPDAVSNILRDAIQNLAKA